MAKAEPEAGDEWQTLVTPHFRIHHQRHLNHFARRVASAAEATLPRFVRDLQWRPSGRVDLTMADSTDDANGYATVTPRNAIVAFAAPPPAFSSLQNFDDWLALLVAHELAHVVHLDIVYGVPRAMNVLEGKANAPNASLPSWFTEGLAVVEETRVTGYGRIHSTLFAMMLRTAAAEGALLRLDQLTHNPLLYPFTAARYVYGAAFVQYLVDRFGMDRVARLAHRFGELAIPLGFDRMAQESFGQPLEALFAEWQDELLIQVQRQRQKLNDRAVEGQQLTFVGEGSTQNLWSRFVPGSAARLVFQRNASARQQSFVQLDLASGVQEELLRTRSAGMATLTAGRNDATIIYEQQTFRPLRHRVLGDAFADGHDLVAYSLGTHQIRQLTHNARVSEPDVSPNGQHIVAVQIAHGGRRLVTLPRDGGTPKVLWGEDHALAYSPAWSPQGDVVAFVATASGRRRRLYLLDIGSNAIRCVHDEAALVAGLRFTPDGRHLVFSSDRDGTYNVYALDLKTQRLWQVTNVFAGAFAPVVSPDGATLVYTGFTAKGFDLFRMPFTPSDWREAPPVVHSQPLVTVSEPVPVEVPSHNEAYHGWRHLYPRTWALTARSEALGLGPSVGIETNASDPLAMHDLTLRVDTSDSLPDASVRLAYTWQGWFPTIGLAAARWVEGRSLPADIAADAPDQAYKVYGTNAFLNSTVPIYRAPAARAYVTAGIGWSDVEARPEPATFVTDAKAHFSAYITATFDNSLSYTRSVAPQSGRKLAVSVQGDGSAQHLSSGATTTSAQWTEYGTWPWATLHTWALSASGGISRGPNAGVFALGGYESQALLRSLYQNTPQCCEFLRGYAPASLVGPAYIRASGEYRAPVLWIEQGVGVFPIYLRRLHGAAFLDVGNASSSQQLFEGLKYGTGLELRLDLKFGFHTESTLMAGWARALGNGARTHAYLVMAVPF